MSESIETRAVRLYTTWALSMGKPWSHTAFVALSHEQKRDWRELAEEVIKPQPEKPDPVDWEARAKEAYDQVLRPEPWERLDQSIRDHWIALVKREAAEAEKATGASVYPYGYYDGGQTRDAEPVDASVERVSDEYEPTVDDVEAAAIKSLVDMLGSNYHSDVRLDAANALLHHVRETA